MPSKILSAGTAGLEAQLIEVEVQTSYGLRKFDIVGLPDKSVQESKDRVSSAIESAGFKSPHHQPVKVLVSLAPADLKKEGALYDLPIALGYLAANRDIKFDAAKKVFLGELALDGRLRPIKGAVCFAIACREQGMEEIVLPKVNAPEARLIKGLRVTGVETLAQTVDYLQGKTTISENAASDIAETTAANANEPLKNDMGLISGQEASKRALTIVAAGGHNLSMWGPPGTGKTLLAKALSTILPPLSFEESLEVTKIYSICGLLPADSPLISQRPFRAPHHTSSAAAVIGGGNPPRPGEITLAHRGVLFLDEFPEFHRDALEAMRQPIEEGTISVLRAKHAVSLPARFTLVLASNPCPCGNFGNPEKRCSCSNSQISMYRKKLSGPLMDRVDLFINVPAVKYDKLAHNEFDTRNASASVRETVCQCRQVQLARFGDYRTNAEMNIPQVKEFCRLDEPSEKLLKTAVDSGKMSARGYHRVLKVSRTIADLAGAENIKLNHVAEALAYRPQEVL
ncbi:MAG: YifB family Mg chelatase-like AAA ATPase [Candidatus Pacebacteria bacterium]|jgi:magnesium chelatase family protein|nr:YifB family Mg chelatase-like AAA ATPase [Candidatus Paceibacterota bacterium]